jgi:signal transduction histidine kinase
VGVHPAVVLVTCTRESLGRLVARELRAAGFLVVEADPADAMVEVRRCRPLVVVAEASPGAPSFLDAARAEPALRDVPVVALTDRPAELTGTGVADVVPVPFEPATLVVRVRTAARTAELWADLRRRTAELLAFARRAGHDLKSPLTVVVGIAQTLAHRWEAVAPEERTRLLGSIAAAAERAAAMVSDLTALARAGTGALDDPWATADAGAVARRVADGAGLPPDAVQGTWTAVRMSPDDLAAVLTELCGNAVTHGAPPVTLTATPAPEGLHVVVRDAGPGFDASVRASAFDPFTRGPGAAARDPDGTGVGLAVVRRVVEQWGGAVSIDAAGPDSGAAVRLVLPRSGEAAAQAPTRARAQR